jgi:replicative DNA helicase
MFWKLCTDKEMGWKEFYYPTMVNPEWSPRMEKELRGMFSEVAYQHEVLAEFGEETVGVFNKDFIDRARHDYTYREATPYKAHRIVGVDWDKYGDATQIVITEYNPSANEQGVFQIINRIEIPKSQFTLDNGVRKIIELNETYDPDFIYVDRGYGEYQVETLHKYGLAHKETNLAEKVKGISFSEYLDVRDPFTKVVERKPVKPFMVNQTSLLLERDRIWLNDNDDMVWKQMENYQVIRKTVSGQPVFTSGWEHSLDAFMLSILGFVLNMPELTNILEKPSIARTMATAKFEMPDPLSLLDNDPEKRENSWDEPGRKPARQVPVGTKPDRARGAGLSWARRGSPDSIRDAKRLPKRKSW